jgi:hypothetical protein
MALAPNFETLLLGRIITGLGVGVSFVVVPVYISEITPSDARGALSTCFDISINVGILFGYLAGFLVAETSFFGVGENLTDESKWRIMLGLGGILPAIVIVSLTALPESPRWLASRGRTDEARIVLSRFLGNSELVDVCLQAIHDSMDEGQSRVAEVSFVTVCQTMEVHSVRDDGGSPGTRTMVEEVLSGQHLIKAVSEIMNGSVDNENDFGCSLAANDALSNTSLHRAPPTHDNAELQNPSPAHNDFESIITKNNEENVYKHVKLESKIQNEGGLRSSALTWREALGFDALESKDRYLRRVVWIVVGVGFWQQATGSEAVLYYSNTFLERAGLTSVRQRLLGYILIGLCKLVPEALVMLMVDHVGRR